MAEVWAARVEGPQGFVKSLALKFILESFAGDPDLERLFVNEARLAAQLQHANLVGVFDFDKVPAGQASGVGRYYIVMERVHGHDLRRVLHNVYRRGGRLSPGIALHIAGEVLKGLRYVHERCDGATQAPLGLVHRDVSPHNILIGMVGEVKLSDFGIAKAISQSLGTQAGMIRGKLAYASPEQLRSEPLNHRTDQFALGVTLWEALAGQRLFEGGAEMEIIGKVLRCQVPPLPVQAGVSLETEAIVRRMLSGDADARFPSTAAAFAAIVACPGYSSDPAALEALMREVFAPQSLELPPTLPLEAEGRGAAPMAVHREVETLKKRCELPAAKRDASAARSSPRGSGRAQGLSQDGVPARHRSEGRLATSATVADEERSVTGSAYVSAADELVAGARSHPSARVFGLLGALAIGAVAIFVGARRSWTGAQVRPGLAPPMIRQGPPAAKVPSQASAAIITGQAEPLSGAAVNRNDRERSAAVSVAVGAAPREPPAVEEAARRTATPGESAEPSADPVDPEMRPRATATRPRRPVRATTQIPSPGSPPAAENSATKARNDGDPKRRPDVSPAEHAPNGAPVLR